MDNQRYFQRLLYDRSQVQTDFKIALYKIYYRTGQGEGMQGISLLVIEKEMPGVKCKKMKCQGMWSSGTTYIILEGF